MKLQRLKSFARRCLYFQRANALIGSHAAKIDLTVGKDDDDSIIDADYDLSFEASKLRPSFDLREKGFFPPSR